MRRSISIIAAAAIAAGISAASFAPAQAAPISPPPVAQTDGAILQVQNWENFHGDRHNAFRDDGWDRDRPRHRRHRHQRNFYPNQFYFGFPFGAMPPFYMPYRPHRQYYQDCFRTWDGQLICR